MELLRNSIVKLDQSTLANAQRAPGGPYVRQIGGQIAPTGPGSSMGPMYGRGSTSSTAAFDKPIPVIVVGPKSLTDGPRSNKSGDRAPKLPDATDGGTGRLLGAIGSLLAPLSIVASIFQGFAPGLQLVSSAMKLLGAMLLPVILPGLIGMAVAAVMITDQFNEFLEPVLDQFYSLVLSGLIPTVEALVNALMDAVRAVRGWGESLGERVAKGLYGNTTGGQYHAGQDMSKFEKASEVAADKARQKALSEGRNKDEADEAARYAKQGGTRPSWMGEDGSALTPQQMAAQKAAPTAAGNSTQQSTGKGRSGSSALKEVLTELRSSMGPKASFGSIADLNKNVTLAGLNESPFEKRITEMFQRQVIAAERAAAALDKSSPRYPTAGAPGSPAGTGVP